MTNVEELRSQYRALRTRWCREKARPAQLFDMLVRIHYSPATPQEYVTAATSLCELRVWDLR